MPLHHERERTPREEEEGEEGNEFAERISIFSSSGFLFPSGHGGNGHSPAHSSSSPSLLSKSLPVEIPIFKLNSSPPYSTLHSTLRENGQSAGAPFLPSFHPSPVLSGSCPRPPTDRPTASFLLLSTDFRGKQLLSLYSLRSFVRSFFQSSFPISFNCDRWRGDSRQEPPPPSSRPHPRFGRRNPFTQLHFLQKVSP